MGETAAAAEVLAGLQERQPGFSLQYVDATYPFRQAADRAFFLEGLRKAGMTLEQPGPDSVR
jgi:hypothetical protein